MEFKKAKEVLEKQEKARKEIKERGVKIGGTESKILKYYLKQADRLLEELRQTKEGRNNEEKIRELAIQLKIETKDLERYFQDGLRFNIKAAYKLGELPKQLIPEEELKKILEIIITGYVLNFRSTLRHYLRKIEQGYEITPKTILKIASHTYILSPRIIDEIKQNEEFKDMDDWIIKYSVVGYPTNPEEFLRNVKSKIEKLKKNEEFKDMDDWIIKHAVVGYPTNPEEFLRAVKERLKKLEASYPQLNPRDKKMLAVKYPQGFLKKAQELIEGKLKLEELEDDLIKK
jgi:Ni,Fe-hydrogenase III small subunit